MDHENLPKTRQEALTTRSGFYFTGIPCKRGHVAVRETKGNCTVCRKEDTLNAAEARKDYFKDYNRREDVRDRKHEWYVNNSEAVKDRATARPVAVKRVYQKAWKERNQDKVRADTKARRRKHRSATPAWLSATQKAEIREIYRVAIHMTRLTGEQYVVDHIYPLRSDTACGLHVPWNLRVITRKENLDKSNKHPTDAGALAYPDGSGGTHT